MLPCRYIAGYVGVGNFSHQQLEEVATTLTPKEARKMLKDTFIVQEYVPGGSLKDMVLAQVPPWIFEFSAHDRLVKRCTCGARICPLWAASFYLWEEGRLGPVPAAMSEGPGVWLVCTCKNQLGQAFD